MGWNVAVKDEENNAASDGQSAAAQLEMMRAQLRTDVNLNINADMSMADISTLVDTMTDQVI